MQRVLSGSVFIEGLQTGQMDLIRSAAKTDLHNHACLGYRLERLREHIGNHIPPVPERMPDFESFVDYLRAYLHPHIYTREGFEFSIREAMREAVHDGVTHLEMSIDAQMYEVYGSAEPLIAFLDACAADFSALTFWPEIGVNREWEPARAEQLVLPLIDSGYFQSIDLYGNEKFGPPETFRPMYQSARAQQMLLKAHAGEFRDAEYVRRSVEVLELDEVQHGIAAANSPEVMRWLADHDIALHVCPTSNVRLSRVSAIRVHPIRKLVDAGVRVTINSDDIMIFGQTAGQEYLNLFQAGVLTAEELDAIRVRALQSRDVESALSFTPNA
ncbi:MAG: hypothetical protein R3301_12910 [Saprospiraceae bacterium]|nr:hypothetical protein [Saprospiraceae bacterium]